MAKKIRYICSACGHEETGWTGKCPACGTWGSMEECEIETNKAKSKGRGQAPERAQARPLSHIALQEDHRLSTGYGEIDRVLGGGLVRDSLTLLTAPPGAGKSTLLLQIAGALSRLGIRTLYASGEESASQIKARSLRILEDQAENVYLISTASLDQVLAEIDRLHPQVVFVDSLQTFALEDYPQRPGTPTQTVQVASALADRCKRPDDPLACFLVGHMTKEDQLAGLRTLEHLVDTVLVLEKSQDDNLRLLRSTKNRFGWTGEIGLFLMEGEGLVEVQDPYAYFLTQREAPVEGAAVSLQKEGSRLIPIEIEALVSTSHETYPTRIGASLRRDELNTLVSVLEEKAGYNFANKNVVLKITGGLAVKEKLTDLAVLAAIASSADHFPIRGTDAFLAEVGLTGELKRTSEISRRLKELDRLGFQRAFISADHAEAARDFMKEGGALTVFPCKSLAEVLRLLKSA